MSRISAINKNLSRKNLVKRFETKRSQLKKLINDVSLPEQERFKAVLKLSELPRNSSKTRIKNRCKLTGRPRGFYRKFELSRIELRRCASFGLIPGLTKSSW